MKLEQQVISLELAKKLKELGVGQESAFCWEWSGVQGDAATLVKWEDHTEHDHQPWIYSAFTVSELGEMLPIVIGDYVFDTSKMTTGEWYALFRWGNKFIGKGTGATEAEARGNLMASLVEAKLINITTI